MVFNFILYLWWIDYSGMRLLRRNLQVRVRKRVCKGKLELFNYDRDSLLHCLPWPNMYSLWYRWCNLVVFFNPGYPFWANFKGYVNFHGRTNGYENIQKTIKGCEIFKIIPFNGYEIFGRWWILNEVCIFQVTFYK